MVSEHLKMPPNYLDHKRWLEEVVSAGWSKEAIVTELFQSRGVNTVGESISMLTYHEWEAKQSKVKKPKKKLSKGPENGSTEEN